MGFNRTDFYDAELERLDVFFRAALEVKPGDRVLDVGCGAGASARHVARTATDGSVTGVDISEEMLRIARHRSRQEGIRNIEFLQADAQRHPFPTAAFDLCISRFGMMFFDNPAIAFANIGRAMRRGARLVLMVWQDQQRNEWSTAIQHALGSGNAASASAPAAFSLGDRRVTTHLLRAAGFAGIDFTEVHEPVFYGPNLDAAIEAIVALFLAHPGAGPDLPSEETLASLRALVQSHATAEGVFFDSHAWIVTAGKA